MKKLTRRQKIVIRLYRAGASVAHIAKAIGANVGATHNIVKRLRNLGHEVPYRRGRNDATVPAMRPKHHLYRMDIATGRFQKVAPPRPYNFRNHQIAKNLIAAVYNRLRKVEALLK